MGTGLTAAALSFGQIGAFPTTALLSVLAIGPLLDFALLGERKGPHLYARFILGGAAANLLAFGLKSISAFLGWNMAGGGNFARFSTAVSLTSYILCGALAGLFGAAVWFRFRECDDLRRN
jgi:hypothetical protein